MFFYVLAFSPLPAERDFRGRTLLGNSRLAGRCAEIRHMRFQWFAEELEDVLCSALQPCRKKPSCTPSGSRSCWRPPVCFPRTRTSLRTETACSSAPCEAPPAAREAASGHPLRPQGRRIPQRAPGAARHAAPAGLITPRVSGSDHGAADRFAPEDLDAFLDRLLDGARKVKAAGDGGRANIPDAARLACCTSEEIVRMLLDRKLARKWRLTSERGYMSVLVDVEEVRSQVRGPDHGGLTGLEIKDRLSTTAKVAAALIKHGHLKTITVVNPVNRCPTVVVPVEEVERFAREYISLFALAKQQGRHFLAVKKELDAAGVEPALDQKKIGATFNRRSDC